MARSLLSLIFKLCHCAPICLSASAGIFFSDFEQGAPPGVSLTGSASVQFLPTANESALILTPNEFGRAGSVTLPDLDPGSRVIGFVAQFNMYIGTGSGADGISFNFASDIVQENWVYQEEGDGTGITVCFDTYWNPNEVASGIAVKVGGRIVAEVPFNVASFRKNSFVPVVISANEVDGLSLRVDGIQIFNRLPVPMPVSSGRFILGGRTGGLTDEHIIDDLLIETETGPAALPFIRSISHLGRGAAPDKPITVEIEHGAAPLNTNSFQLLLNGNSAPFATEILPGLTRLTLTTSQLLQSATDHTVRVRFAIVSGQVVDKEYSFRTAPYSGPTGHYYQYVQTTARTWSEAEFEARARRFEGRAGHLATVNSAEEADFIESVRIESARNVPRPAWLGGYQLNEPGTYDGWTWVNNGGAFPGFNGEFLYANWNPGEPNDFFGFGTENHLTTGETEAFGWNDRDGSAPLTGYIVEYEPLRIECPQDQTLFCNETNNFAVADFPKILNCPGIDPFTYDPQYLSFTDEKISQRTVRRRWVITTPCGTDECFQRIDIERRNVINLPVSLSRVGPTVWEFSTPMPSPGWSISRNGFQVGLSENVPGVTFLSPQRVRVDFSVFQDGSWLGFEDSFTDFLVTINVVTDCEIGTGSNFGSFPGIPLYSVTRSSPQSPTIDASSGFGSVVLESDCADLDTSDSYFRVQLNENGRLSLVVESSEPNAALIVFNASTGEVIDCTNHLAGSRAELQVNLLANQPLFAGLQSSSPVQLKIRVPDPLVVEWPLDVSVLCSQTDDTNFVGWPRIISNCQVLPPEVLAVTDPDPNDDGILLRHFTVRTSCGETNHTQKIFLRQQLVNLQITTINESSVLQTYRINPVPNAVYRWRLRHSTQGSFPLEPGIPGVAWNGNEVSVNFLIFANGRLLEVTDSELEISLTVDSPCASGFGVSFPGLAGIPLYSLSRGTPAVPVADQSATTAGQRIFRSDCDWDLTTGAKFYKFAAPTGGVFVLRLIPLSGASKATAFQPDATELGCRGASSAAGTFAFSVTNSATFFLGVESSGTFKFEFSLRERENTVPSFSKPVANPTVVNEGMDNVGIQFEVTDLETAKEQILVTATFSEPSLATSGFQIFPGLAGARTLFLPNLTGPGTMLVTLVADDLEGLTATNSFLLRVNASPRFVNLPAQLTTAEDVPLAIPFSITDDTPTTNPVTISIQNPQLVQKAEVTGVGPQRVLEITPAPNQYGSSQLTITLTDADRLSTTQSLTLDVTPVNDPPLLSSLPSRIIIAGRTVSIPIPLIDLETAPKDLPLTARSSNASLNLQLNVTSIQSEKILEIMSPPDRFGSTVITIDVVDGEHSRSTSFDLHLRPFAIEAQVLNGNFQIRWNATINRRYQIQSATSLGNWTNYLPPIQASNEVETHSETSTSAPARFYRVLELE